MTAFQPSPRWESSSGDPNDETFGDVVEAADAREPDLLDPGYDVVVVGEPFDVGAIGRRGAASAPEAIRSSMQSVKTRSFDVWSTPDPLSIGDLGDVDVSSMDVNTLQKRIEGAIAEVHDGPAFPVFLGGDNSVTVANARPLLESRSVGVVNFDAHLDVREVRTTPTSGTPYRQLFDAGLDAYTCVGARHHETSGAYVDYLEERGGTVVTAEAVDRDFDRAMQRARDGVADVDVVYLSVDCDVLDAAAAPGVSAPTPGGLTTRELFQAVRRLADDDRLAGFEVVECAPPHDEGGRTVDAAARTVAHFLAGYGGAR